MLEDVKASLRISESQTAFDKEIQDLIDAAKLDLKLSGVAAEKLEGKDEVDSLIRRAITVYCKAHFGYESNTDAVRFRESYDMIKNHITLAGDYT